MHPTEDERRHALRRAEDSERSLARIRRDQRDAIDLLERLDGLAVSLSQLAQHWDDVNSDMATRVRRQERQLHELIGTVRRVAELEANEASVIMSEISEVLKQARSG
jgi:hypothetical protein